MRNAPPDATTLLVADRLQSGFDLVRVAARRLHDHRTRIGGGGFDLSSYGRRFHSKKTQVRLHESICSGESTRSSVCESTRRLKAWPTELPHGAGSMYVLVSASSGLRDRRASTICWSST